MVQVIVKDPTGTKSIKLDKDQLKLFTNELKRIKKYFPSGKGIPYRISPDCLITVINGQKTTEYELFSRAVLVQTKTQKKWQFYFGLLLMEWLH